MTEFIIPIVHKDWYEDGIECSGPMQRLENLWRLDFSVGENEYQAQLFAELSDKFQYDEDEDFTGRTLTYQSFRLLIERDNRHPAGNGERVDYAFDAWPLTAEEALELLALPHAEAVAAMMGRIKIVEAMPNDREFIRQYADRELPVVEEYWAKLDTTEGRGQ